MTKAKAIQSLLVLLLVTGFWACQTKTITKAPASVATGGDEVEDIGDDEAHHRQTFVELMKIEDREARHASIKKFLDRQRNIFFVAQDIMDDFDERLDGLYAKKKLEEEITAEDFHAFNEMRFKNLIVMEFSETNLHELADLYRFTLESAKDRHSPYYEKARDLLLSARNWFTSGWIAGDRGPVVILAQRFEDMNREVFPVLIPEWVPRFKDYTELSVEQMNQIFKPIVDRLKSRREHAIDYFVEKQWQAHLEKRRQGLSDVFDEMYDARTPQSMDTLEPDPGPSGHVTGNRFPKGAWTFTFDDGPHPTYTPEMFQNLNSHGLKATFFWLTQNLLKYPDLAKKAGEYGFSRACHSYTHANLPTLKPAALNHEVNEALDGFAKIVGAPATMYRCPYGACGGNGSNIRMMIAGRNALEIFWNVDTLDWQDKNPQTVFERAKKQVDILGRGIILFHDIHPQSVVASGLLMDYIKSNSQLKIALLKDLIGESRGKPYASP
jgi:peptidoglycan/xylan/chitin deacetylase (PgdA/CDA1 family)